MNEEATARLEPRGDAAERRLAVAHVLEHLDRHHAVEPLGVAKRFMSVVTTLTVSRPRRAASASMCAFWLEELETAVMRLPG